MSRRDSRLLTLLALQPGEAPRLTCLLLHSLFLGLFTALFLSASLALFLERFPVTMLPFAYVASSLVGFAAVSCFTRLSRRVPPDRLAISGLLALLLLTAAFWGLSVAFAGSTGALIGSWIAFAMVVCIAPAVTLLDLGFWTLATRLFDLRQGKRLFGLVGAGEVVASILGFFLVPLLLLVLRQPIHLLPIAAGALAAAAAVAAATGRRFRALLAAGPPAPRREGRSRLASLIKTRYFALLAVSTTLFIAAFYLVDFSFLSEVPAYFEGSAQVARFLGVFFGAARICELLIKTLVFGRLLNQLGLRAGLLALPAALLVCVLLAAAAGTLFGSRAMLFFLLVALVKLVWMMLARSVFDPSCRVLYQPLPAADRISFQGGIEGAVRQIAVCGVGISLALAVGRGIGALALFRVLLPALAVWVGVVALLYREYRERLLRTLGPVAAGAAPRMEKAMAESDRNLLFARLGLADRNVQLQAVLALAACGSQARSWQEGLVKRRIEELVEITAWDLAALVDLDGVPAAAATRRSLELDLEGKRRTLYRLLSLLYDPQAVRLATTSLENGAGESLVYALEILDVLVSPDLKPILLPILERLAPAACLARLESFAPQPRLSPAERLSALLHREQGTVAVWTRASALGALGELGEPVAPDLIANLFHPDPVLQEEAAVTIHGIDPDAYARYARKLPAADQERLGRLAAGAEADCPGALLSAFARARLFRAAGAFARLPREVLLRLATAAAERHLQAAERLDTRRAGGALLLVVAGRLAGAGAGQALLAEAETPLTALEPTRLLRVDGDRLQALAAEHPHLAGALRELTDRVPASELELLLAAS